MLKILIIDKQRSVRNILREKLEFEGYATEAVESLHEGFALSEKATFDVIILEEAAFYEYLSDAERPSPKFAFIVSTDSPSIESAVKAIRMGAYDFITKPIDMNYLLASLKRACEDMAGSPTGIVPTHASRARAKKAAKANIVGSSTVINHVKRLIEKVGPSEARVLITGPNGTGKELVAHSLHEQSPRCEAPFIEVNCAAIPSELIESELFGHEKGAFTSAIKQRKGKFEQANGGTLFLDEIGDMSLSAQAKVLRALQENRICRVGSDRDIVVDVRIVAATNKDLKEEIRTGHFREDLYHRLSVIIIPVPPLVDRIDDIPLLVDHFIETISREYGVNPKSIDKDAVAELKTMDWTGNIRELRNVVERLIILSGDKITREDVRMYVPGIPGIR